MICWDLTKCLDSAMPSISQEFALPSHLPHLPTFSFPPFFFLRSGLLPHGYQQSDHDHRHQYYQSVRRNRTLPMWWSESLRKGKQDVKKQLWRELKQIKMLEWKILHLRRDCSNGAANGILRLPESLNRLSKGLQTHLNQSCNKSILRLCKALK